MTHPWQEIGDRVFVRRYEPLDQTIGAVIGEAGVVVIDTRTLLSHADELRADLRALADAPLAAVVNSHGHHDHVFGNQRFRPAPIWGHVRCAAMIRETGERQRAALLERVPPELREEVARIELTEPTELFEDAATLDLGDRRVELRHIGRGHTDNDIVVLAGDVLFAGDLLENGSPPFFGDGFPLSWPETGRRLLDLVRGPVAPGHGDVADRAFAERQVGEIAALGDLVRRAVAGEVDDAAVIGSSPYPEQPTRHAIERGRLEAGVAAAG